MTDREWAIEAFRRGLACELRLYEPSDVWALEQVICSARQEALDVLREVEWSARDHAQRPYCHLCGGYKPEGDMVDEPGHKPDCRLAAMLR